MGPAGMRSVAELCLQKARYAAEQLAAVPSLSLAFGRPTFKEFVVRVKDRPVDALLDDACQKGVFAGVPLGRWYPDLRDCLLVAVTEKRTKQEIEQLAAVLLGG